MGKGNKNNTAKEIKRVEGEPEQERGWASEGAEGRSVAGPLRQAWWGDPLHVSPEILIIGFIVFDYHNDLQNLKVLGPRVPSTLLTPFESEISSA